MNGPMLITLTILLSLAGVINLIVIDRLNKIADKVGYQPLVCVRLIDVSSTLTVIFLAVSFLFLLMEIL